MASATDSSSGLLEPTEPAVATAPTADAAGGAGPMAPLREPERADRSRASPTSAPDAVETPPAVAADDAGAPESAPSEVPEDASAPTPEPEAEPVVAEPGSGLLGTEVVPDLGGTLVVVPGEVPAPGTGTVRPVRIEVEAGLPVDPEVFAQAVLDTLNDPRGWSAVDGVTFARTADESPDATVLRVVLASPTTTDELCSPLDTAGTYSCGSSADGVAVLNFGRWVQGATEFGNDTAFYRRYLVNHEVGHVLGHHHESCPAPGKPAPVMVQQTISAQGCVVNGWPKP